MYLDFISIHKFPLFSKQIVHLPFISNESQYFSVAIYCYVRILYETPVVRRNEWLCLIVAIFMWRHSIEKTKELCSTHAHSVDSPERDSRMEVTRATESTIVNTFAVHAEVEHSHTHTRTSHERNSFPLWLLYNERVSWRIDHAKYSKSHYIVV